MKDLKPGQIGCVESKYNELDIYEQAETGFNVGIGSIKFDLTAEQRKYIQGEKRPAVEELQRIIDNFYRIESEHKEMTELIIKILGINTSHPTWDILECLSDAAETLLHRYSYDGHGHELIN